MSTKQDRLEKCITEFVSGIINGSYFEQVYSDIFDFEDEEVDVNYFGKIRNFLEHFSPYDSDLNKYAAGDQKKFIRGSDRTLKGSSPGNAYLHR
jgi:hypothetical protein